jgi:outer membrane protein assembly factor BamD
MIRVALIAALALALQGCFLWPLGKDGDVDDIPDTSEQVVYRSAQSSMRAGNYRDGVTKLQHLEARFPFGRYAEQAQLELVYAYYMSYQPEAARTAADRFIRLHPQHPNVDYAYYMKGLAAFNEDRGLVDRFSVSNIAERDMTSTRTAFADFNQLLTRFPDSEFANDARQRMIYLRNLLANHEVSVANYYMRRGAFIAAANRARFVVESYPQATSVDQALAVLIEANFKLGLTDAANDSLRVLALNYPDFEAFAEDGTYMFDQAILNRHRGGWLNTVTFGLLGRPDIPPPIRIEHPEVDPSFDPNS